MISAKIIAHSKSSVNGKEIVTFELEYPRFIHAELMTHRLFSRNAASSRAIPVAAMIEQVRTNPALPVHWGANQAGMQAQKALSQTLQRSAMYLWRQAARIAASTAEQMVKLNLHKQVANRILEPFQMMKTVVTATEFDNWFWLRKHADAQPEIRVLAEKMWEALEASGGVVIAPGDWHVPYFKGDIFDGVWCDECDESVSLEDALAISSSCCAQVSYRKLDDSVEKARTIYARLVESEPVHASPFEHQATPMEPTDKWDCTDDGVNIARWPYTWEQGITHAGRDGKLWSGNLCGFIQHRQLIPNNACWNFKEQE